MTIPSHRGYGLNGADLDENLTTLDDSEGINDDYHY
jgi:hypothetical protein